MDRDHQNDDLIDLGTASIETRGAIFGGDDLKGGLVHAPGLSDE
jgi:hypothetical protein